MIKKQIHTIILKIQKRDIRKEYNEIENIQNKDNLIEFKKLHLERLILHAYKKVPYYHQLLKDSNVIDEETINFSNFEKIPILTKNIIRNKKIISNDYTSRNWFFNSSGGSTGEPTRFIQDIDYSKWADVANTYYYKEMLEIDEVNVKKIVLWGSSRDLIKGNMGIKSKIGTWLTNTVFLNSFRMTELDMEKYVKTINSYKPEIIRGYAGSLFELCRFAEAKNIKIYTPKIVISSAETLNKEMREKIESVFGTKLYDFYGSRETASLAGECKCGLIHIFEFNNYIEILDENNQPVKEGQEGRIIVTNLHNYSMPFIRYEIGDMATLGPSICKCGNILPTLERICGRIEEQFIKRDGTIVIGYFFVHLMGVVLNKGLIKKFQVIQEDYEKIRIFIIPCNILPDAEKKVIEEKVRMQMGQDCKIIWEIVDEIPKTTSGKYLYTKSFVSR